MPLFPEEEALLARNLILKEAEGKYLLFFDRLQNKGKNLPPILKTRWLAEGAIIERRLHENNILGLSDQNLQTLLDLLQFMSQEDLFESETPPSLLSTLLNGLWPISRYLQAAQGESEQDAVNFTATENSPEFLREFVNSKTLLCKIGQLGDQRIAKLISRLIKKVQSVSDKDEFLMLTNSVDSDRVLAKHQRHNSETAYLSDRIARPLMHLYSQIAMRVVNTHDKSQLIKTAQAAVETQFRNALVHIVDTYATSYFANESNEAHNSERQKEAMGLIYVLTFLREAKPLELNTSQLSERSLQEYTKQRDFLTKLYQEIANFTLMLEQRGIKIEIKPNQSLAIPAQHIQSLARIWKHIWLESGANPQSAVEHPNFADYKIYRSWLDSTFRPQSEEFQRFQKRTTDPKELQGVTKAFNKKREAYQRILEKAENPLELVERYYYNRALPPTEQCPEKILDLIAQKPNAIIALLTWYQTDGKLNDDITDLTEPGIDFFLALFSAPRQKKMTRHLAALITECFGNNYQTAYNGAEVFAALLNQYNGQAEDELIQLFTQKAASVGVKNSLLVLKNVLDYNQLIPAKKIKLIAHVLYANKDTSLTDAYLMSFLSLTAADLLAIKSHQYQITPAQTPAIPLHSSLKDLNGSYPHRDLDTLVKTIKNEKSSHISSSGNILDLPNGISSLTIYYTQAKVKPAKTPKNTDAGLSGYITLTGPNVDPLHLQINPDGSMHIRKLDKNGIPTNLLGENESLAFGINAPLFSEIHYLALEILSKILVRKKPVTTSAEAPAPTTSPDNNPITTSPDQAPSATPSEESQPAPQTPPSDPPPSSNPSPDLPPTVTSERNVGEMAIDLTDRDKLIRKKRAEAERKTLETNRAKVKKLFEPLLTGEQLPQPAPAELAEVTLFRVVTIGGKKYYERIFDLPKLYEDLNTKQALPTEVYVRRSRAYTLPLTYDLGAKTTDAGTTLYTVHQRHERDAESTLRKALFKDAEEGQDLETKTRQGVLYYDAEVKAESPWIREMFEAIRNPQNIHHITQKTRHEIEDQLKHNIWEARKKHLEIANPNLLKYLAVKARLERYSRYEQEKFQKEAAELQKKAVTINEQVQKPDGTVATRTRVRFPAYMPFEETFAQGHFETLENFLQRA